MELAHIVFYDFTESEKKRKYFLFFFFITDVTMKPNICIFAFRYVIYIWGLNFSAHTLSYAKEKRQY